MALQSNTQIFIGGTPIRAYKRLMLHQQIDAHHTLELVCRMDVLEAISTEIASHSKNYLGQIITIQISSVGTLTGYEELEFKGIITSVNNTKGFHQQQGDLVTIKGYSCSIIADDGPHYTSYSDVDLSTILDEAFRGYDRSKLQTNFSPSGSDTIHYSVQHNESAFQYASRLAAQYSDWFYYDGSTLIFGTPNDEDEVTLMYGQDLQEFSLNLIPTSNNYKYFTNDYLADSRHEKSTGEISSGTNGYTSFTNNKADEIFPNDTHIYIHPYTDASLNLRLDTHVGQQKKAEELKQVIFKGSSDNPGVKIGQVVSINVDGAIQGRFRITKITHTNTENGRYQNEFEGVIADLDVYPHTNIRAFPKSETQVAIVKENNDPEGLGRIKAQFSWQHARGEFTPWLRVMTPHAGGDKGFHFIPEIGEEVLIGFEGGNAERPYVLGSLYNGGANPSSWQSQSNDIKAIRTRSGHTIELNDSKDAEFITITDKNHNIIKIDTFNNNIDITANETMTFNAKNMELNIAENLNINVGKNLGVNVSENKNESIGKNLTLMAKNSTTLIEEKEESQAKEFQKNAEKITINSTKDNMELSSAKQVVSNSGEKNILI